MKAVSWLQDKVLLGFTASLLAMSGIVFTSWKLADNTAHASHWVRHTYDLLDSLALVRSATLEIEINTQNYRLSLDPAALTRRDALIAERERLVAHVTALSRDNTSQQRRLQELKAVIAERTAISRRIEILRKTEGAEAAGRYANAAPLAETRERLHRILRDMESEGHQLLSLRIAAEETASRHTVQADIAAVALMTLLLGANYLAIRRQQRRTADATRQLHALLEQRVEERSAQLRVSEAHLESVINSVPGLLAFVDPQQRYVYANRNYLERFGAGVASIAGRSVREVLGETKYEQLESVIERALSGESVSYDWQPAPDTWELINVMPRRDEHQCVTGYYVLGTEITERKRAEEQIRTLNDALAARLDEIEHVSRALRTLSAGNRTLLHARDEADLLDSMCRAIVSAGGYRMACVWYRDGEPGSWLRPMAQYGHPGGMDALLRVRDNGAGDPEAGNAVASAIRSGTVRIVRRLHEDPSYAPWRKQAALYGCCIASPVRLGGEVIGALAIYSSNVDDFSDDESVLLTESADDLAFGIATFRARAEQERTRQAIHRMTWYDELTGLPNGNRFTQLIQEAIAGRRSFALLQVNVERLREINEALGFAHGDALLGQFGARLLACVGDGATVARLRGDEFGILLPDSTADDALRLAQQMEPILREPFPIADLSIEVAAHIGIAAFPAHGASSHDLYRHMDIALNHARMRRVGHAVFEPAHSAGQAAKLVMIGELRRAIEGEQLRLYLQPKVDMRSGTVCGAEGLVRWASPSGVVIPPEEFIGLVEKTMLIKPLTEWVIESALKLTAEWQVLGCALPIAINLSAVNLRDDSLLETVQALRQRYPGAPGMLEMELTESMLMEDAEHALRVLATLHDAGIPLYIDDFGTGYSSLSYLSRLPVDCIKIDRSFVHDMLHNESAARIVRSTIDLAHDLGRKVVAEGVETQEHWAALAAFGCDIAQGFFIARPMAPEEFPSWMERFHAPDAAAG